MSRDFLDTLKRFTPDDSGLNRDALLFEAGRRSAPSPARAWWVASLLALTQALMVGFLMLPPASVPINRPAQPVPTYPPSAERGSLLTRELGEGERPLAADQMTPDEPPLRPFDPSLLTTLQ
jgi:hypothetical protein